MNSHFTRGVYVFDVDGTLTDTGAAHITFCNDVNAEFGFKIKPIDPNDPVEVKRVLGTPMSKLLSQYGFPEKEIAMLDQLYSQRFSSDSKYKSQPFPEIKDLLKRLAKTDRLMVLLTSNTSKNVKRDLGSFCWNIFDNCIDRDQLLRFYEGSKAQALNNFNYTTCDNIPPHAFICVGDTEKDYEAAAKAGCRFVGVTYGWQIQKDETRFPIANNVQELKNILLSAFN